MSDTTLVCVLKGGAERHTVTIQDTSISIAIVQQMLAEQTGLAAEAHVFYIGGKKRLSTDQLAGCFSVMDNKAIATGKPVKCKVIVPACAKDADQSQAEVASQGHANTTTEQERGVSEDAPQETTDVPTDTLEQTKDLADASTPSDLSELSSDAVKVTVRQGKNRYVVFASSPDVTIATVKRLLVAQVAVPAKQQKLLAAGKLRENEERLAGCGVKSSGSGPAHVSMILTFTARYHDEADGGEYLDAVEEDLKRAQRMVATMHKQLNHRLCDVAELSVQINMCQDLLGNLANGLDRVRVKETERTRKQRVVAELKSTIEKLDGIRTYRLVKER